MIRRLAVACLLLAFSASTAAAQAQPDTNKDGYISKTEHLAAADRGFARMDADKDGVIGPVEQAKIAKMLGGRNILAPADLDKNGKVSKAEFAKASAYRFEQFDADKDGKLNKTEQAALQAARGV